MVHVHDLSCQKVEPKQDQISKETRAWHLIKCFTVAYNIIQQVFGKNLESLRSHPKYMTVYYSTCYND